MRNIFNSFTGSFFRTIGRILAYIAIGLILIYFAGFLNIANVDAYVYMRTYSPDGYLAPLSSSSIINVNNSWVSGNSLVEGNTWLYDVGQFWYGEGLHGNYLNVSADYYLGVETLPGYSLPSFAYFNNNSINTLKQSNLRCGIGNYASGYDGTYAPQISNFSVEYVTGYHNAYSHDLIHIKFNYSQQLSKLVNINGSNMSCWFERTPSDGLFAQILAGTKSATLYTSYTSDFSYSVSTSPEYGKLQDIEDSINQTNDKLDDLKDKQDQTNQELGELNDSITSTEGADLDGLSDSAGWLPAGPIDSILNLPLTYLNSLITSLGDTCNPITLTLPFIDEDINLPCLSSIYSQIDGLSIWINTIGVIASAIILFSYFMRLYKWVDDTLTFRENNYIDNWGGV